MLKLEWVESAAFWHSVEESALGKQAAVTGSGALFHFVAVGSECSEKTKKVNFNWL